MRGRVTTTRAAPEVAGDTDGATVHLSSEIAVPGGILPKRMAMSMSVAGVLSEVNEGSGPWPSFVIVALRKNEQCCGVLG